MTTYFKAVRPDGRDFYTGRVDYLTGGEITHPITTTGQHPDPIRDASCYFSVSTVETDCTGFRWPARLLEVTPVGDVWTPHPDDLPNKRACRSLRVLRELPAHRLFGPQGPEIVALLDKIAGLNSRQLNNLSQASSAALRAALGAARSAARSAAWSAACGAARSAVWGAALGLMSRDLVEPAVYDALTLPFRRVVGRIHPADADVFEGAR